MKRISEIFVVLENRPGTLGELCAHLAENKINIEAIGVFQDTAKLFVKNLNKAVKVLTRLEYETEVRDVLLIELENRPGALADVTSKLGNKGINVEYCYATMTKKGNKASVILDVNDIERALKILKA
ncbi:MAG: ACT domain-containing protein [Candidatus Aminicenantes bacterium]|nr:ACT domain-containing protein [Candidatus Aminicenantes bacterium]